MTTDKETRVDSPNQLAGSITDAARLLAFADSLDKLESESHAPYDAAAVIRELVKSLDEINEFTMSQPAELNMPDDRWYRRCANELRGIAYMSMKKAAEKIGETND